MFYTIKNVWGEQKQSMKEISKQFKIEIENFKNVEILGLFVDNHDMPRFLHHSPN